MNIILVGHGVCEPPRPPRPPCLHARRAGVRRHPASTIGRCRRRSDPRGRGEFAAVRSPECGGPGGVLRPHGGRAPGEAAPGPECATQAGASGNGSRGRIELGELVLVGGV